VLTGYLRRGAIDVARASAIAEDAEAHLRSREYQVSTHDVLRRVASSRCSAYDCEFVVLAEHLGVPLVTNDRDLLADFPKLARRPDRFVAR
jgi:predicted nucleic acid-binding protein